MDSIISISENITIINSSKWSPVQPVNIMTKSTLLQQLIYEEVIDKRHCQLNGIKRGLEYFGMVLSSVHLLLSKTKLYHNYYHLLNGVEIEPLILM